MRFGINQVFIVLIKQSNKLLILGSQNNLLERKLNFKFSTAFAIWKGIVLTLVRSYSNTVVSIWFLK